MKSKLLFLTITLSTLINNANSTPLALSEGPFENFNKCTISHGLGTLEIGHVNRNYLKESSVIYASLEQIEQLARLAINGAGDEFYRWFVTQTDYYVRGEDDSLVRFDAQGITNIYNPTEEAQKLISIINDTCNHQLTDFRILGEFQVDLKIGDRVFNDKLNIQRVQERFGNANVEGTYDVPGSFSSYLKNIEYIDGNFSFVIRVQEGTDDYEALFEGNLNRKNNISGKAYILPERKLLGTFTGKKI